MCVPPWVASAFAEQARIRAERTLIRAEQRAGRPAGAVLTIHPLDRVKETIRQ